MELIPAAGTSAPTLQYRAKVELANEPRTGYIFKNILIKLSNKYPTRCRLQEQSVEARGPSERGAVLWAALGLPWTGSGGKGSDSGMGDLGSCNSSLCWSREGRRGPKEQSP